MQTLYICFIFSILTHSSVFSESTCGCNKLNRNSESSSRQSEPENGEEKCASEVPNKFLKYQEQTIIYEGMSRITGGTYEMGTNEPVFASDRESPERTVRIRDFYLDKYEVSNNEFHKFVVASKYKTDAETFGDSFVFEQFLTKKQQEKYVAFRVAAAPWWYKISGVNWLYPKMEYKGKNISSLDESRLQHPVVHVSWRDAVAFCTWKNKRLPTEAEWEIACRGQRKGKLYPWGNAMMPKNQHWMNIWQGKFPQTNTAEDGYYSTNPVDVFPQNTYELYNIVGNVWEWTADAWDPNTLDQEHPGRVKKGGSYLCHETYCYRYRCAARSENTQDSSSGNLGFRCAKDIV